MRDSTVCHEKKMWQNFHERTFSTCAFIHSLLLFLLVKKTQKKLLAQ